MRYRIIMEVKSIESSDDGLVRVNLASPQASTDRGRSVLSMMWTPESAPEVGMTFEVGIEAQ